MTAAYVPDRGDLVWLEFTPQTGSEQAGRRPALVISPKAYNAKVGLALFCPVTSRVKGYPSGLIQSLSHGLLPGLSAWVEVGGIASSLCLKAPTPQPIST